MRTGKDLGVLKEGPALDIDVSEIPLPGESPPFEDFGAETTESPEKRASTENHAGSCRHRMVRTVKYDKDPNKAKERNIFDTHCHLDRIFFDQRQRERSGLPSNFDFKDPPLKTLKSLYPECFGEKFEGCISVCCDPENWKFLDKYEYLMQEKEVYLTFGCHPSKAHLFDEEAERMLREYLDMDGVVAVGEIGLDETYYNRDGANAMVQMEVFARQLEIAMEKSMPICIHLRGNVLDTAHRIMKGSLGEFGKTVGIHLHCYNYTKYHLTRFMQDFPGMKFGLVPHFFDYEVGRGIKMDKFLIETDAPYFIPKQLKDEMKPDGGGRRYPTGLPGMVYHSAKQLAVVKDLEVEEVLENARRNAAKVYCLPPSQLPKNEFRRPLKRFQVEQGEESEPGTESFRKLLSNASCTSTIDSLMEDEAEMKIIKKPKWSILPSSVETKAQLLTQLGKMKKTLS